MFEISKTTSNTAKIDAAITEAENDYNKNMKSYEVKEVFSKLKKKNFG